MSLSMILKFFFNFGRFEPCDSYKLYSYKKESVYITKKYIVYYKPKILLVSGSIKSLRFSSYMSNIRHAYVLINCVIICAINLIYV